MDERETVRIAPVQQRAYAEYLDWVADARPRGVIRDALFEYYGDDIEANAYSVETDSNRWRYTVFTKPKWLGLTGELDDYIGRTKSTKKTEHNDRRVKRLAREMYMRQHEPSNEVVEFPVKKLLWNGDSLCVSGLVGDDASFEVERTDFYSYVSTGESMLRELYDALWDAGITSPADGATIEAALDHLPQRDRLASTFADYTMWADHIHKVGPVCQLVLTRPDGTHEAYYTKRSQYVLQAPGSYSVTPAGELQAERPGDVSMQGRAIEILTEEVLGVPDEMSGGMKRGETVRVRLKNAIQDDEIHISRTAFGFDMHAVKPIFAGLVYVSNPETSEWFRRRMKTNWEADKLKRVSLPLDDLPRDLHPNLASSAGALAFYEGLRALERGHDVDTGIDFDITNPR